MASGKGGLILLALFAAGFVTGNGFALAAQDGPDGKAEAQLTRALAFANAGHPAQAIAAVHPLLDGHGLSAGEQVRVLELEGIAYQSLGEPERAMGALKAAEHLLGPNEKQEMAAVQDDLGRVAAGRGDWKGAARLYHSAFTLEEASGNHAGMARVANNQAGIALHERKVREARAYLERAEHEAEQASDLDNDACASIASMQGWLAMREGNAQAALRDYRHALQLWREEYGEQHPLTAWGLVLTGQALVKTGNEVLGVQTMRSGLDKLAATLGIDNQRYDEAELAYAGVLEQMGRRAEALRLQADAQARQTVRRGQSCADCAAHETLLR